MNKKTDVVKTDSNGGGSRRALREMMHLVRWDHSSEGWWWLDNDDTAVNENVAVQLVIAHPYTLPLAYIALHNHVVEIGLMAARPLCGALICFREFSSTQADPGPWPKRVGKIGQGRRGS